MTNKIFNIISAEIYMTTNNIFNSINSPQKNLNTPWGS